MGLAIAVEKYNVSTQDRFTSCSALNLFAFASAVLYPRQFDVVFIAITLHCKENTLRQLRFGLGHPIDLQVWHSLSSFTCLQSRFSGLARTDLCRSCHFVLPLHPDQSLQ